MFLANGRQLLRWVEHDTGGRGKILVEKKFLSQFGGGSTGQQHLETPPGRVVRKEGPIDRVERHEVQHGALDQHACQQGLSLQADQLQIGRVVIQESADVQNALLRSEVGSDKTSGKVGGSEKSQRDLNKELFP